MGRKSVCRYQRDRRWGPLGDGWDGGHLPVGLSGNLTLFPFKTHGVLFNNGSNSALGKGERCLYRPQLCGGGGRRGRGKKKRRVSPSPGLGGCCQLLLLSSLACVRPSPQWPWSIVCGSQEGDWSPLSLGTPESGSCFPVPAQRKRLPCFTEGIREGGARCTKFC